MVSIMSESAPPRSGTISAGPFLIWRIGLPLIVATTFASGTRAIAQSRVDSLALAALFADSLAAELARPGGNEGPMVIASPNREEHAHWRSLVLQALIDRHPEAVRPPTDSAVALHAYFGGIRFSHDTAVAAMAWSGCIPGWLRGRWWSHGADFRLVRSPEGWAFGRRVPGWNFHGTCDPGPPRPFVIDTAPAPRVVLTIPAPPPRNASPQIVDLVREPSGGIYVAITGRAVARFSLDGAPLAALNDSAGRPVMGDRLAWAADTLWVSRTEAAGGDATPTWLRFDRDGRFAGRWSFPDPGPGVERIRALQPLGNGRVIGRHPPRPDGRAEPAAVIIAEGHRVVRPLRVGTMEPTLVTIPDPWGGGTRQLPAPFRAQAMTTVSHDGAHIVGALGLQPREMERLGILLSREALSGDSIDSGGVPQTDAVPVTELARAAFADSLASDMASRTGKPVTADGRAAVRASLTFPEFHGNATDLLTGEDGSAWIRLPTDGPMAIWLQLDPQGKERRVALPADFRGLYADANDLWGSKRSATGQTQLVRYIGLARPR
jgi:hypothetical protein